VLAGFSSPAAAWGNLLLLERPPSERTLAFGASAWQLPRFPGASTRSTLLLPGVDYYSPQGLFVSTDSGVGWNTSSRADLQAGVRVWPQFGRPRADTPAGLTPIGTRLQAEAFLNYSPLPVLLLQSGLLRGSGRNGRGQQFELGATSGLPLGEDLLGIGMSATFANSAFRQSYFGVSADESAASGLPMWSAGGGWHDISVTFSAEHRLGAGWRLSGQWVMARLIGPAARSPLTASARQTGGTLTLWRDF
jgi:outer membrane scaffolding protein for murein synthesis (MipA/OmpV family)